MDSARKVNLLLLGESGAGKSTFINSFANFEKYETLYHALNSEDLVCPIPVDFTITDENYKEYRILEGSDENERHESGRSTTKDPKVYNFEVRGDVHLRIIDSPGVGDSRGLQQDVENVRKTMEFVADYGYVDGIIFLLKSNVTVLNEYFKFCISYLLTRLESSALGNIIFVFTHTRSTFYRPGDTLAILKKVLEDQRPLVIPCKKENMFCVDNEAFRYLVASQRYGVNFLDKDVDQFAQSWYESATSCSRLLDHILGVNGGQGLKPYRICRTVNREETLKSAKIRVEFLTEVLFVLSDNAFLAEKIMQSGQDRGDFIHFKRVQGGQAVVSKKCKKVTDVNGVNIKTYSKKCHEPCDCTIPNPHTDLCKCVTFKRSDGTCMACDLRWEGHSRINYELRVKLDQPLTRPSDYVKEKKEVLECVAVLMSFISSHIKVKGDLFKDRGQKIAIKDKRRLECFLEMKELYARYRDRNTEVSAEDVHVRWDALKMLNFTGQSITEVFEPRVASNVKAVSVIKTTIAELMDVAQNLLIVDEEQTQNQQKIVTISNILMNCYIYLAELVNGAVGTSLNMLNITSGNENTKIIKDSITRLQNLAEVAEDGYKANSYDVQQYAAPSTSTTFDNLNHTHKTSLGNHETSKQKPTATCTIADLSSGSKKTTSVNTEPTKQVTSSTSGSTGAYGTSKRPTSGNNEGMKLKSIDAYAMGDSSSGSKKSASVNTEPTKQETFSISGPTGTSKRPTSGNNKVTKHKSSATSERADPPSAFKNTNSVEQRSTINVSPSGLTTSTLADNDHEKRDFLNAEMNSRTKSAYFLTSEISNTSCTYKADLKSSGPVQNIQASSAACSSVHDNIYRASNRRMYEHDFAEKVDDAKQLEKQKGVQKDVKYKGRGRGRECGWKY